MDQNHTPETSPPADTPQDPGRRDFFAKAFRDAISPLAHLVERRVEPMTSALQGKFPQAFPDDMDEVTPPPYQPEPTVFLRPPGAKPGDEFETLCSRCGQCAQACPVKCIQLDNTNQVGDGFPYIVPALAPCVVCDEQACMKICPSGALTLVDKFHIQMGLAVVTHDSCLRYHGEDCRLCLESCPLGEQAIVVSDATGRVLVKPGGCVGCGMCEQACPTQPTSIQIQPAKSPPEIFDD